MGDRALRILVFTDSDTAVQLEPYVRELEGTVIDGEPLESVRQVHVESFDSCVRYLDSNGIDLVLFDPSTITESPLDATKRLLDRTREEPVVVLAEKSPQGQPGNETADQPGDGPADHPGNRTVTNGNRDTFTTRALQAGVDEWLPLETLSKRLFVRTTRYALESARQKQELERAETTLEAAGDMIYTLDAEGRFTFVNEALTSQTGYSEAELLGSYSQEFVDGEGVERSNDLIRELLNSGRDRGTVEMKIKTANGGWITCENHIALLPREDQQFRGTAGVLRDITERKQREQQLQVFNRILRHNLRNRLSIARAHVSRLVQDDQGERARPEDAMEALENLLELTEQVRTVDRAMSVDPEWHELHLSSLLSHLADIVSRDHPDADISIESTGVTLTVLPSFELALQELLENAVKHAENPVVEVSVETDTDAIVITVADNGPGIPEQERDVLVAGKERPLMHGTGLGLWMVNWVVESHGGSLETDVGEAGTRVIVTVPQSQTQDVPDVQLTDEPSTREQEWFESLFDSSPEPMVLVDEIGSLLEVNDACLERLDRDEAELLGKDVSTCLDGTVDFAELLDRARADAQYRTDVTLFDGTGATFRVVPDIVYGHHLLVFE